MRHPFRDTPQYEQIYTNKYGYPIGRPGNGLGDVWGGTGAIDPDDELFLRGRRPRPNNSPPRDAYSTTDVSDFAQDEEIDLFTLHESIGLLTTRQAFVIRLRYGLRDGVEYTLEEIASFMGVTNQAVSKIEQLALSRLEKLVARGRANTEDWPNWSDEDWLRDDL